MGSPLGADDSVHGALSHEERAALSTWADEADASDGFTDKVLLAWLAEQGEGPSSGEDEALADAAAGVTTEPHPTGGVAGGLAAGPTAGRTRLRRVVGWGTAIAAAAVVMLMVRVLPPAAEEPPADPLACAPTEGDQRSPASAVTPARVPEPEPGPEILGAQAAQVLAHHCNPCHDSTDPEGKAGALDVFDLDQSYWWPTMSDAQLEDARDRVRVLEAATDDERERVDAFVEAELQRRARAG